MKHIKIRVNHYPVIYNNNIKLLLQMYVDLIPKLRLQIITQSGIIQYPTSRQKKTVQLVISIKQRTSLYKPHDLRSILEDLLVFHFKQGTIY